MRTAFRKSFARDLKKIKDQSLLDRVAQAIERVEAAAQLQDAGDVKKLGGSGNYFRIRVGGYRIGLAVQDDTVVFMRCLPRRDLYRFCP